jgi:MYXO-CTERM domain-containing protein
MPDVVQAGDTVSFSFAFQFERDEVLLATQAEISAPQLSDFRFATNSGISGPNPWDLTSTFRRRGPDGEGKLGNPMWVHAENVFDDDPQGVTWDEVGGLAPLGSFSAIASYNGEIVFDLSNWTLLLLDGFSLEPGRFGTLDHGAPLDPAWAQLRTGVTIVGGLDLPPPPPPPAPPEPAPVVQPPPVALPVQGDPALVATLGVRPVMPVAIALNCEEGSPRPFCRMSREQSGIPAFDPDVADEAHPQLAASVYVGRFNVTVAEPASPLLALLAAGLLALIRRR